MDDSFLRLLFWCGGHLKCPVKEAHTSWLLKLYKKEQMVDRGGEGPQEVVQTFDQ